MRAFVTGGTGFIGANVVRALLADGHEVRALVRPSSDLRNLTGLPLETVSGDLTSTRSLTDLLAGCDALFHVGALYSLWKRHSHALYEVNVRGTERMLRAAADAKVSRVVYTSSVATIGVPPEGEIANEEYKTSVERLTGDYKKSKFLAEAAAMRAAGEGLDVVVVNPSTPVGPYDIKPTPTGEIVVRFLEGRMPFYVDTGLNLIDVRDVARGHMLAWEKGKSGSRYILGNRNVTLLEMLEILSRLTGIESPKRAIPHSLPLAAAFIDEVLLGKLPGWRPSLSLTSVQMSRKPMYYSSAKAVRELGLPQSPVEDALATAVEWFRQARMVSAA
jgi:dihydroflavonol-4-reductase